MKFDVENKKGAIFSSKLKWNYEVVVCFEY